MRKPRGSSLVVALLLTAILLVAGLGILAKKATQYSAQHSAEISEQALLLARSGLDDALLKLGKDLTFPSYSAKEQQIYTYSEHLYAADETTVVGDYRVTIDRRLAAPPSYVLLLSSLGTVGTVPEGSPSRREIYAELDLNPGSPTHFQLVNYQDLGVR